MKNVNDTYFEGERKRSLCTVEIRLRLYIIVFCTKQGSFSP